MKIRVAGQIPNRQDTTLSGVLESFSNSTHWNDIRVAVAYASVAGLFNLLDVLKARTRGQYTSRWLFGLDDYLTQPGVLRICLSIHGAELRTARLSDEGRRFHPKLLIVSQDRTHSLTCVGSSNLTLGGMSKNCEAYASITSDSAPETELFFRSWDDIWQIGSPTTEEDIDAYEAEYNERASELPDGDELPDEEPPDEPEAGQETRILTNDSPALDPSLARTCWIEVGKNTAMGRELEFKAEQALFFGLSPSGGPPQNRFFLVSSGALLNLRLKYQENAMWRLQMNNEIPEVEVGLRPRDPLTRQLGRSPLVAVFTRGGTRDTYILRFIRDDSAEYVALRRQSVRTGTFGSTSARRYGWC
jgi:HKD family nuclease